MHPAFYEIPTYGFGPYAHCIIMIAENKAGSAQEKINVWTLHKCAMAKRIVIQAMMRRLSCAQKSFATMCLTAGSALEKQR